MQNKQQRKPPKAKITSVDPSYEQNAIKRLFISPLIKYLMQASERYNLAGITSTQATDKPLKECLETIFGTMYRDIVPARATKSFAMPGLMWGDAGLVDAAKPTTDQAHIRVEAALFVRIDERMPNRIDIELAVGEHGRMFTLSNVEYRSIRPYLKELERCPAQALEAPNYTR